MKCRCIDFLIHWRLVEPSLNSFRFCRNVQCLINRNISISISISHKYRFMEKRKPYDLKGLLAVYNLAQVAACCYLIYGILRNEFSIIKFWKCQAVDYNTNDKSVEILTYSYHTFLLKLLELVETVFFVMRKKQNQVSKLHVYHHTSTAILGYIMVKYTGGKWILLHMSTVCAQGHTQITECDNINFSFSLFLSLCLQAAWFCSRLYSTHSSMSSCTATILLHCSDRPFNANWKALRKVLPSFKWYVYFIMLPVAFICLCGPSKKLFYLGKILIFIVFNFQIQFTIILTQCVFTVAKGCDIPKMLVAIYVPNVSLIFYMFYDFFKKAYKKKSANAQKAQKAL